MDINKQFEDFLGINTEDENLIATIDKEKSYTQSGHIIDYSVYEATNYRDLVKIFDELHLTTYDTLVDFGCGLGRVLFYCNHKYLCNVTGVEYNQSVYDSLVENAEAYHKRFQGQRKKFSLLKMKAEEYVVEARDNYFYMFNPFSMEILEKVMDNIIESWKKSPREITLIIYYCTYDIINTLRGYKELKLHKIIKLPGYDEDPDEKVYIYNLEKNKRVSPES